MRVLKNTNAKIKEKRQVSNNPWKSCQKSSKNITKTISHFRILLNQQNLRLNDTKNIFFSIKKSNFILSCKTNFLKIII